MLDGPGKQPSAPRKRAISYLIFWARSLFASIRCSSAVLEVGALRSARPTEGDDDVAVVLVDGVSAL